MSTVRIVVARDCPRCEEVKYSARRRGYTVAEIPAEWIDRQPDRDEIQAAIADNGMALPVVSIDNCGWGAWNA